MLETMTVDERRERRSKMKHWYHSVWRPENATIRDYVAFRGKGWTASDAIRSARIRAEFANLEWDDFDDVGDVRLRVVPDDDWAPAIECGCEEREWCECDNRERADRDGVWGIVGEYRDPVTGEWLDAESVWGFIGDDWKDSRYDDDVKAETLRAYREAVAQVSTLAFAPTR